MATKVHALTFKIVAECSTTKARVGKMALPHSVVDTPVFMPVGTQGTLKGVLPEQLRQLDCRIMLGNTYHLGHRPVNYNIYKKSNRNALHDPKCGYLKKKQHFAF